MAGSCAVRLSPQPLAEACGRALYRQVTRLGALQDFRDVTPASAEDLRHIRPVSDKNAEPCRVVEQ